MARPTMPPWPPEVTNAVHTLYSELGCGFRELAADFELLGEGDEEVAVDEGPAPWLTPVPEFEPAGVLVETSDAEGLEVEADVDETESVTEIEDEQTGSDRKV